MSDNKWMVELEQMGKNIDTLRVREKQMLAGSKIRRANSQLQVDANMVDKKSS